MYRRSLKQKRAGVDLTVSARLNYTVGKCILFAKGGYDTNAASNIDPDGNPYDLIVTPGTSYLWGSAGVEYFPLKNQNVRIHALLWGDNRTNAVTITTGITFRLYLKKPVQ